MKKYRALVPVVLIVVMLASWYMLISNAAKIENQYNTYLTAARAYAKDGTKYAIENYNLALSIKSSPELYKEIADYYKNQKNKDAYLEWCEDFLEVYPKEALAYECLVEAYVEEGAYADCFDLIYTAQKRKISSAYLDKVASDLKYSHKVVSGGYEDVALYSNGFCAVSNKERWGFVDAYGQVRIGVQYLSVSNYTQYNVASVVNQEEAAYYIDNAGEKVLVAKGNIKSLGAYVGNVIVAKRDDDKYVYVNTKLETIFGEYDYASAMNSGVAAVKKDGKWHLINEQGAKIGNDTYLDVKVDANNIAYNNGRAFVSKTEGKYILVDGSGKQVGNLVFQDAEPFMGGDWAAVKLNDKWQFIDINGKLVSDKTYAEARSASNGMAAVCIDGLWGFVDEKENVVIEPKFEDALYFNDKGSCFIKEDEKWRLLKLYRLNREG